MAAPLLPPSFFHTDMSSSASSPAKQHSTAPPPRLTPSDDRTWEDILSSRIPSEYDASRPLWQQWVDTLQAAVDEHGAGGAVAGPSTPRLSYPPSSPRLAEEHAGSRALEKAGKAAFSSPKRSSSSLVKLVDNPQIPFPTPPSATPPPSSPSHQPGAPPTTPTENVLAVLVPLLVLLSTLLLLLLLFLIMLIIVRRRARIALASGDGPLDIGREEELEGAGGLEGVEERWLSTQDEATRSGYARAKDWLLSHPPGSVASEITISQFLSIQEKGVSAWSFEPDYESNSSCFVEARTEITFVADGEGMSPREGGGCSVQSNLPLPKVNDVYYWEAKMFSKPASTNISLGLATKPYPSFRLPGWSKHSVGFFSQDGFKCHNYPFAAQSYGPAYVQGDVIGVGYRPRTGTVFYTRNGKKLEDAFIGLQRYNVFPTIGADGPAEVHVNLGQAGFVFIEANVKKWGLAPMTGTLAPPPAYGQERGSILIEAAGPSARAEGNGGRRTPPPPPTPPGEASPYPGSRRAGPASSCGRRAGQHRIEINPASHQASVLAARSDHTNSEEDEDSQTAYAAPDLRERSTSAASAGSAYTHNPPTPNNLDISLHALSGGERRYRRRGEARPEGGSRTTARQGTGSYFPAVSTAPPGGRVNSPSPPPYSAAAAPPPRDSSSRPSSSSQSNRSSSRRSRQQQQQTLLPPTTQDGSVSPAASSTSSASASAGSGGSLGGTASTNHSARRSSGRTHRAARDVFHASSSSPSAEHVPALVAAGDDTSGGEYERRASTTGQEGGSSAGAEASRQGWGSTAASVAAGWGRGVGSWWNGAREGEGRV